MTGGKMIKPTEITASWQKRKVKCSCGQERNPSGLRQHLKINKAHRPPGRKGYKRCWYWHNGLTDQELNQLVKEIRDANSEPVRFRQATFEEMFESGGPPPTIRVRMID
jgi:hypothetical protein